MDTVISQTSPRYLEALIRYGKTLLQRNALLKQEARSTKVCSMCSKP